MVVSLLVSLPPLLTVLFCLATTGVGVASAGGVRFAAVLVPRPPRPRALPLPLEGGPPYREVHLSTSAPGPRTRPLSLSLRFDSPVLGTVTSYFLLAVFVGSPSLPESLRQLELWIPGATPPNVMDLCLDLEVTLTRGCVLASLREAAAVYRLSVRTVSGVTLVYRPEAGRVEGDDCEHIYYTIKTQ